jgi:hypothetical protein
LIVVRNLPILSIEVTSLETNSSGIPAQEAGGFGKPVCYEPVVLAYLKREFVVAANLRTKMTFCMQPQSGPKLCKRVLQYGTSFERLFLSAGSQYFWHTTLGT